MNYSFYLTLLILVLITVGITNYAFADDIKQLGIPFHIQFNQTATIQDLQIKIINLTDSRCPSDVTCIWQGQAKILVDINRINQNLGNVSLILNDKNSESQSFDHYSINLIEVNPYPISTNKTHLSDYDITLKLSLLSPLKQLKAGISQGQFTCIPGLTLVIKSEDNSPACVKSSTIPKLVERGWTTATSYSN